MGKYKVLTCRKPTKCEKCGREIAKGEKYIRRTQRTNKRARCNDCGAPRPSEMTGSETLSQAYSIQENLEGYTDSETPLDIVGAIRDASNAVEELITEIDEKISNIEEYFPSGSPASERLQEHRDGLEEWQDELDEQLNEAENLANILDELYKENGDEADMDGEYGDKLVDLQQILSDLAGSLSI